MNTFDAEVEGQGGSRSWHLLLRNPLFWVGSLVFIAVTLFCFLGPVFYHANPYTPHLLQTLSPPNRQFPLGTDGIGRNVLIRLMIGGQQSLEVGVSAAVATVIIGTSYGLISGYFGGTVDVIMMRIVDALLSIPAIFFLLFIDSVFRPSAAVLIFVIAVVSWFGVARLVRAEVLKLKPREFIEAEKALGATSGRVIVHHLLPNVLAVVVVATTLQVANAILTVAGLSFLGLGLPPPAPNWGQMLSDSMSYMFQNTWWLIYPPGLAILLVELSVNFLGDAVRQAYDPRLKT